MSEEMESQKILKFLSKLKKNNNKTWFDKNKDEYLEAKEAFDLMIAELIREMEKIDPAIKNLEAKNCTFRIYKDVRFSKDKTPYKTHFGAYLAKGGRKSPFAGYYIHLSPGSSMLAGGLWMPEADILGKVRQEIDYNTAEFLRILKDKNFKKNFGQLEGEKLSRNPKGYPPDHPHIELFKFKSFNVLHPVSDTQVAGKDFLKYTVKIMKTMKPLNDFLNVAVEGEEE